MWHPEMPEGYKDQIVAGDCRDLVKRIPNESVDIVFTSPPYNVGKSYVGWDDKIPDDEFWQFQRDWIADAFLVTSDPGRMYAVISDRMMWRFRQEAEACGWKFHQLLVWCKPNIVCGGRISGDWNHMTELCLLFHKGKTGPMLSAALTGVNTFNWIAATATQSNFNGELHRTHPAQMPIEVAYTWLARTPGDVVYDPFAGSGTTCCAAKRLGKSWVAFEVGPSTAESARERVRNTQPPLFVLQPEQQPMALEGV